MRRLGLFVLLLLAAIPITALVNADWGTGDSYACPYHSDHHSKQQQAVAPKVDGAVSPQAIPDSAAYEIVLKLLSSQEPDKIGDRREAYLRVAGFNEGARAAIKLAAQNYRRLVTPLEKEEDDIKNQTWPSPDRQAMERLNNLQRQKEALIAAQVSSANIQLQEFNEQARWDDLILKRVKSKTKGFPVALPPKKVGRVDSYMPDFFGVNAQAPGCDALLYIYSDTVFDSAGYMVYGYTSYSTPSNNCGHSFTPYTSISGAQSGSGGDAVGISLDRGDHFDDGGFTTASSFDVFCPVASQTYYGGSNSSGTTVGAFVDIGPFVGWTPSGNLTLNQLAVCNIQARGSTGSEGLSFSVNIGAETVSGEFYIDYGGTGTGSKTITSSPPSLNRTLTLNFWYKPTLHITAPARFKAVANVTSSQLTIYNSPRKSDTKTINP